MPDEPDNFAFRGMSSFVRQESQNCSLQQHMVSRNDYLEQGHHYCNQKFYDSW